MPSLCPGHTIGRQGHFILFISKGFHEFFLITFSGQSHADGYMGLGPEPSKRLRDIGLAFHA